MANLGGRPPVGPRITVAYPAELLEQINEAAERNGISRATWLRQAATDTLNREVAAMNLTVTVSDVRELLASGNEQPVLYVNTEDGPAKIDVWADVYVQHHWRIASRDEITDMIGDNPSTSDIRNILGELQETVDGIDL